MEASTTQQTEQSKAFGDLHIDSSLIMSDDGWPNYTPLPGTLCPSKLGLYVFNGTDWSSVAKIPQEDYSGLVDSMSGRCYD